MSDQKQIDITTTQQLITYLYSLPGEGYERVDALAGLGSEKLGAIIKDCVDLVWVMRQFHGNAAFEARRRFLTLLGKGNYAT